MAFGITRKELNDWKKRMLQGEIAFLTHYWYDQRFPHYHSVTKVGCISIPKLIEWGEQYNLSPEWIHNGKYPHFDLMGERQVLILEREGLFEHIEKFNLNHINFNKNF